VPKIGPNDVLLRVRAAGVGLTVVIMTANPGRVTAFPRIPGHKVAGEVVELGSEVTHVRAGDRVTSHFDLPRLARGSARRSGGAPARHAVKPNRRMRRPMYRFRDFSKGPSRGYMLVNEMGSRAGRRR
jgi:NADPH:quinone reductase-like Zn-dependent oxidoreductase